MKKKIYLSGKITGLPHSEAVNNFNVMERLLRAKGYEVINPFKLPNLNTSDWHECMKVDIKHLMDCDAVCVHPNWIDSKGAKMEVRLARALKMEVLELEDFLI